MSNLHAAIHQAVTADTSRLISFERSSTRSGTDWDHRLRYEFDDGAKVEMSSRFNDSIVFPASPGFELLTIERLETPDRDLDQLVHIEPVLAWTLEYDHGQSWVTPVTTSGYDSSSWTRTFKAVRLPDGKVQWHAPFDQAACSVIDEEFGQGHRDAPIMIGDPAAWVSLVRRVWDRQIEDEKKIVTSCCASCGRASTLDRDGDIPF
jgi:hypothetical protein